MKKWIVVVLVGLGLLVGLYSVPVVRLWVENAVLQMTESTELRVDGDTLYMNGTITSATPQQLKDTFSEHPGISTLVMQQVAGSIDDDANLEASRWLAKKQLTFRLEPSSEIASGGTDMFLAGKERFVADGARVGVHAWGGDKTASDYPEDAAEHKPYISYYMSLGWPRAAAEKFYFFTIKSALANGMHWMTNEELLQYGVATSISTAH